MSQTTPAIDLATLTVDTVQEGFRNGSFTAESLARACLAQIETWNGRYNAIIFLNDEAIDDARAIDRPRPGGRAVSYRHKRAQQKHPKRVLRRLRLK
ncbi:hypothetical protein ACEN8K_17365, partial [Variovorax sp. CT11-76]